MDSADAEQLGEFAQIIARASLEQLTPIIGLTLDDCVELLRRVAPPSLLVEQIAALAAEMHKRHPPRLPLVGVRAPRRGNA